MYEKLENLQGSMSVLLPQKYQESLATPFQIQHLAMYLHRSIHGFNFKGRELSSQSARQHIMNMKLGVLFLIKFNYFFSSIVLNN